MLTQRRAVEDLLQPLEARLDDVLGDELCAHQCAPRSFARREDEGVGRIELTGRHDLERLVEVGVALTGKSHDQVRRDREVVNGGARSSQPVHVAIDLVASAHRLQHPVRAGLQREMQLRADRRRFDHRRDRLGTQVLGVGTRVADPLDPLDPPDRAQEIGEEGASTGDVSPVGVDVLAEQRDLADPGGGEHLGFEHQIVERSADLFAAHRRHDAVGAGVITPRLNRDPGREGELAHRVERGGHVAIDLVVRGVQDLDDRALGT